MSSFTIQLKNGTAKFEHFGQISPKLGMIFYYFCGRLVDHGIKNAIVTSIIREKKEDSGVHAVGRAIDVADTFARDVGRKIEEEINTMYPYDPNRPNLKTIIYHKVDTYNDAAFHYHIQVNV